MYCAYTIPGMGGNSLMYYYNGKAVSGEASGRAAQGRACSQHCSLTPRDGRPACVAL
uniref:Uncharacterized protein n=1 Tax=Phasianus colchicus TaxID=9054 RepID=A0A669QGC5_PHACC